MSKINAALICIACYTQMVRNIAKITENKKAKKQKSIETLTPNQTKKNHSQSFCKISNLKPFLRALKEWLYKLSSCICIYTLTHPFSFSTKAQRD